VSVSEVLINKAKYDGLPEEYQAIIEVAAGDNVMHTYAETEALNPKAMNEMLDKYGVTNKRWGDKELATFEKAWNEVVKEESAGDAYFKEIADSYFAFRKVYRTWGQAQALDSTYLK
jgi:TRAP-type mannitol/chloroaromatic compound transport system substrate-binding protein